MFSRNIAISNSSASLKIFDNISVIKWTKKGDSDSSLSFYLLQALCKTNGFIIVIIK